MSEIKSKELKKILFLIYTLDFEKGDNTQIFTYFLIKNQSFYKNYILLIKIE